MADGCGGVCKTRHPRRAVTKRAHESCRWKSLRDGCSMEDLGDTGARRGLRPVVYVGPELCGRLIGEDLERKLYLGESPSIREVVLWPPTGVVITRALANPPTSRF